MTHVLIPNCIFNYPFVFYFFFHVDICRDMRNHDNSKQEWTDEELKKLYETHERLLDLVSLFCFVPRAKYLPLGPTRLDSCMVILAHLKTFFQLLWLQFVCVHWCPFEVYASIHTCIHNDFMVYGLFIHNCFRSYIHTYICFMVDFFMIVADLHFLVSGQCQTH